MFDRKICKWNVNYSDIPLWESPPSTFCVPSIISFPLVRLNNFCFHAAVIVTFCVCVCYFLFDYVVLLLMMMMMSFVFIAFHTIPKQFLDSKYRNWTKLRSPRLPLFLINIMNYTHISLVLKMEFDYQIIQMCWPGIVYYW